MHSVHSMLPLPTVALYSVSGMPRFSDVMSISRSSNSLTRPMSAGGGGAAADDGSARALRTTFHPQPAAASSIPQQQHGHGSIRRRQQRSGGPLKASPPGLSKVKATVSLRSSAFTVITSSLPAHLSILAMLFRFMPAAAAAGVVGLAGVQSLRGGRCAERRRRNATARRGACPGCSRGRSATGVLPRASRHERRSRQRA